ncbi:radical SAM/SPASM domain-containing protein [Candidatus Pyrohabitans sp.]
MVTPSIGRRSFDAFQIEPTSRCNLRCRMCPRSRFAREWSTGDLAIELFRRISRDFHLARHVHLQGWGEPLLHKQIVEMVSTAKEQGCSVGITTNATLLESDLAEELVKAGLDIAGISIAGATEKTHASIRVGSSLEEVVEGIGNLVEARQNPGKPRIVLSFMMTTQSIGELPQAVKLASELGVDELVATNLDYPCDELGDSLRVFSCKKARGEYKKAVRRARMGAMRRGLRFRHYPLEMEEPLVCELDPSKNLFIAHDGMLGPCVYLNQTRRDGEIPRIFCGRRYTLRRLYFGDVREESIAEVLEKPAWQEFAEFFRKRREISTQVFSSLSSEVSFSDLREAERQLERLLAENPLPEQCTTCYKAYGI